MVIQIGNDKKLVESLISNKKVDAFVGKYRKEIFDVMDKQMKEIDPSVSLTLVQQNRLMYDFVDNLLSDDAELLHNYLHPQRLKASNTGEKERLPSLDTWIHLQCVRFFSAKFIIDGILSQNINVIKAFFFSKKRPSCREMFSNWIFKNQVYSGDSDELQKFIDRIIQEYVNVLYIDIERDKEEQLEIDAGNRKRRRKLKEYQRAELTSLKNYKFKGDFYSYFRDYVIGPYLRRKFFPNPDISIDDDGGDEDDKTPIVSVSPVDSHREYEYRDLLGQIFNLMERTKAGRRQVEVLRLLNLDTFDGEAPTEEEIAKMLDVSVPNLRVIHSRALNTAREVAKILKINSIPN